MQNNMLYTTCVLICVVFFNVSLICFECVLDVLSKLAEIGNVTASENVRRTENTEHTVEIQKIEKIHMSNRQNSRILNYVFVGHWFL